MRKKTDLSEKTYNRCLTCPHRNVRCNGPRTSDLPLDRWCELMRDMKEANGLTNAEIAEALSKQGIKLDKRKIVLSDPIKNVGTYTVTCKLGYEISAPLIVKIEEA